MPTAEDLAFKDQVIANHLANTDQIEECLHTLRNYEMAGHIKPLGAIFYEKSILNSVQVQAIYKQMGVAQKYLVRGYTLLESIGQGGLGMVYKARHDNTSKIVAIKVMFPHWCSNADYVQRFMREARIASSLEHPNIVRGLDFGETENGVYFFAMEFVDGQTLKSVLEQRGPLPEKQAAYIILKMAEALKYAESKNLVHRDIKPDNIMITTPTLENKDSVVKLCDLGLAKNVDLDVGMTRAGIVVGTPYYISPEQARGDVELDIRSDIYSLGISFFQLVTGEVPYKGDSVVKVIEQHLAPDMPSPKAINPKLSSEINRIITKMMAKNRDHRYSGAQALIADLQQYLNVSSSNTPASLSPILNAQPIASEIDNNIVTKVDTRKAKSSVLKEFTPPPALPALPPTTPTAPIPSAISSRTPTNPSSAVASSVTPAYAPGVPGPSQIPSSSATATPSVAPASTDGTTAPILAPSFAVPPSTSVPLRKSKKFWKFLWFLFFVCMTIVVINYQKPEWLEVPKQKAAELWTQAQEQWEKHTQDAPIPLPTSPTVSIYTRNEADAIFAAQYQEKTQKIVPPKSIDFKNMAHLTGGTYPRGCSRGEADEVSETAKVESFWLDIYEVSNADYWNFCNATGHPMPIDWEEKGWREKVPDEFQNYPVVNVSYYDACLYAQWLGKRLPTELEIEYATRTKQGSDFPWRAQYSQEYLMRQHPEYANIASNKLSAVNTFALGKSVDGVYHLAGNVWELTSTPYQNNQQNVIIKGGSFASGYYQARATYRDAMMKHGYRFDVGFRCALDDRQ